MIAQAWSAWNCLSLPSPRTFAASGSPANFNSSPISIKSAKRPSIHRAIPTTRSLSCSTKVLEQQCRCAINDGNRNLHRGCRSGRTCRAYCALISGHMSSANSVGSYPFTRTPARRCLCLLRFCHCRRMMLKSASILSHERGVRNLHYFRPWLKTRLHGTSSRS